MSERSYTQRVRRALGVGVVVYWCAAAAFCRPDLTLRVNDTSVDAGGRVAIVLRTYASRPIGQGQLCFRNAFAPAGPDQLQGKGGASPFVSLDSFVIFSDLGDVVAAASFDPVTQVVLVDFSSVSPTVNNTDGPLGVLYFQVDDALAPATTFSVTIDPADSFLFDADGQPVVLRPRAGEMDIRPPGTPYQLQTDDADVVAGQVALLSVETSELFLIGSGQMGVRYPAEIAGGPPTVSVDPRYGNVEVETSRVEPGLVVVTLSSPDGSYNEVPGGILKLALPIRGDAPLGNVYPLSLDAASTFLSGPGGAPINLQLTGSVIRVTGPPALFADDFESGDLGAWSAAQP